MSMLKPETYQQQSNLANYCRNGSKQELKGINENNLPQYRRLVYNIACDTLETAYPITYSFLSEKDWKELTFQFFAEHKCKTPQVWKMPLEFYEYCVEVNIADKLKLPFLNDLLYFEWLELEMHTMEDIPYPKYSSDGNWLENNIVLNPEHKIVTFNYPVHTTAPTDDLLSKTGNYFLLIYREKTSGNIQFIDLSVLYVFVLERIINGELLQDTLMEANTLFQINDLEVLTKHIFLFIDDLKKREFVLGFK